MAAAFFCAGCFGQGLHLEWARTYSLDSAKFNQASKILLAPDGIVVAGTSANASGDLDYVVIKYGADGQQAWVRRYDSGAWHDDVLRDVAIDPNGNLFITGTSDTLKYNSGGQVIWTNHLAGRAIVANTQFVYVTGFSDVDFATAQLKNNNTDGSQNWVRTYNGAANEEDISGAIVLTVRGNVVVGGYETAWRDMRGGLHYDLAAISYSPDGTQQWIGAGIVRQGAAGKESIRNVRIAADNGVYILGAIYPYLILTRLNADGSHSFDQGTDILPAGLAVTSDSSAVYAGTGNNAYATKVTSAFTRAWQISYINPLGPSDVRDLAVDSSDSSYIVGSTPGTNSENDLFIFKVGADGSDRGTVIYGFGNGKIDVANAVVTDSLGNVYVTGNSTTPEGGTEFLTLKYSAGPKIEAKGSGIVHLEFHTNPGQQYSIEATSDFFNWQGLITNNADANGLIQFDDTNTTAIPYRFYRGNPAP